jgi:ATP-dependent Lhr-like helicase
LTSKNTSMSKVSGSFFLLDERIQRFIWGEGWTELRDAQEQASPLIIPADRDVIIAAATAAGKTEAAFLPALTRLLKPKVLTELIVYISPLKALINDQFGRLERLCEHLDVPVWPWHGDISAGIKSRFLKGPKGVLLITPESVEAMLCNRGTSVAGTFSQTLYFVIDELHAFIGTERGKQLQSLLHRIERVTRRTIPRIALSATLGDMALAAEFLRPNHGQAVAQIVSKSDHAELHVLVKGYEEPLAVPRNIRPDAEEEQQGAQAPEPITPGQVAVHLYGSLRGSNNLVFPNSRREVERYTYLLSRMCSDAKVPNEFWPHHGNLSKQIRTETEAALKQQDRPATAICTNTLELGIDIGAVKSVAQIGPPPSVASLRQRLGRSGRRKGEPAMLRGYCIEETIGPRSSLAAQLRLNTVQMAAMISLLTEGWFEPPVPHGLHLSTLVQQLLSLIAQNGGVSAGEAFATLCGPAAPFAGLSADDFKILLRHFGSEDLLVQDSSGLLLHGSVGEKLVNHYTFYAAFASDEEFRIVAGGKALGTLPVSQVLRVGQHILFAGRTWRVDEINEEEKAIYVTHARGGVPPIFSGGAGRTHTRVRQRMRTLLANSEKFPFLDETAQRHVREARDAYRRLELDTQVVIDLGSQAMVMTWLGDAANEAIACHLEHRGFRAWAAGPGVETLKGNAAVRDIEHALADIAAAEPPPLGVLLADAQNLQREKWDWALPLPLLHRDYASLHLDLAGAFDWLTTSYPHGGTTRTV